jgi:hypothetical protein
MHSIDPGAGAATYALIVLNGTGDQSLLDALDSMTQQAEQNGFRNAIHLLLYEPTMETCSTANHPMTPRPLGSFRRK